MTDAPILSLDTTSEYGSIALVAADGVLEEVALYSADGFGHVIYDEIGSLLKRHSIRVDDIACFAGASGPGSFTGVRIGLTVVKGLAEITGKRVAAVSNLQALAWFGSAALRAVFIDARRGEIYGAVYDANLELRQAEVVTKFETWIAGLPSEDVELIANDFGGFDPSSLVNLTRVTAPRGLAGAIGRIAWRRLEAGQLSDPADVDANYVRRSDAELFWKG